MIPVNSNKKCVVCGNELSRKERLVGSVCSNINCRTRDLYQKRIDAEQKRKAEQNAFEKKIATYYRDKVQALNKNIQDVPLFTLPGLDSVCESISSTSKMQFLKFLIKALRIAISSDYSLQRDERENIFNKTKVYIEIKSDEQTLANKLCSMCRGYCCQAGEVYAYITPTMLRNKLTKNQQMTPVDLFHFYKNHLPDAQVSASCVFHGKSGCNLPNELRADICNQFFCKNTAEIIKVFRKKTAKEIFVIAKNETYIVRSGLLTR